MCYWFEFNWPLSRGNGRTGSEFEGFILTEFVGVWLSREVRGGREKLSRLCGKLHECEVESIIWVQKLKWV